MVEYEKKKGAWVIRVRTETASDGHELTPQDEDQEKVGGPAVDEIGYGRLQQMR